MKFTVFLMVVAACIATSVALQCYSCNSQADANCEDVGSSMAKENCDEPGSIEKLAGATNMCLKMVLEVKGIKQVTRSCSMSGGSVNACSSTVGQASEHCSICDEDLCNGSSSAAGTIMWMTLIPAIITVALIKFLF